MPLRSRALACEQTAAASVVWSASTRTHDAAKAITITPHGGTLMTPPRPGPFSFIHSKAHHPPHANTPTHDTDHPQPPPQPPFFDHDAQAGSRLRLPGPGLRQEDHPRGGCHARRGRGRPQDAQAHAQGACIGSGVCVWDGRTDGRGGLACGGGGGGQGLSPGRVDFLELDDGMGWPTDPSHTPLQTPPPKQKVLCQPTQMAKGSPIYLNLECTCRLLCVCMCVWWMRRPRRSINQQRA